MLYKRSKFDELIDLAFLAAFVGITAWAGISATLSISRAAAIWFPNGAILAFLLVSRQNHWWRYIAVGFISNVIADVVVGDGLPAAVSLSLLNVFEVLVAAWLLSLMLKGTSDLTQPRVFQKFIILAIIVAPFLVALLAAGYLSLTLHTNFLQTFAYWFLADALGLAIVTPIFLCFFRQDIAALFSKEMRFKTFCYFLASTSVIAAVFYQTSYPFLFLIPPVLMLTATAQGFAGVTLSMPFFAIVAISATIMGHGPFALAKTSSLPEKVILSQLFILCNFVMLSFIANLATERRNTLQKLENLAGLDGLTGIANRRSFDEILEKAWRRALRDKKPVSLIFMDIDHFKRYNDTYGHVEGDKCIASFAQSLASFANRSGDLKARYGGEEFAIILADSAEVDARRIAEQVRAAVAGMEIPHSGNQECGGMVTTSVGVSTLYPATLPSEVNCKKLIEEADKALYEAKRTGRNKVVCLNTIEQDVDCHAGVDEEKRIPVVNTYLEKAPQYAEQLNKIAHLAAILLNSPIGMVSMVGRDDQVFVGRYGLDASSTSRDVSFCAHTLNGEIPLVVADATNDNRFKNNALVTGGLGIRFYAGAPLVTSVDGVHLGALCVIDQKPKVQPTDEQLKLLNILGSLAVKCMEGQL